MAPSKLFVFETHPIQYRSPVFAELAKKVPGLHVYYFSEAFDGRKWWFREVGKIPPQPFNVRLREGFSSTVLGSERGLLRFALRVLRLLRAERPVAVMIYGWFLPEHWIVWAVSRLIGIGVIFCGETFNSGTSGMRRRLKRLLHPIFFAGVAQIVAIGEKTRAFYRGLRIEDSRVVPAKYCVSTSFFSLPPEEGARARREIRSRFGIPESAFCLLFVGRLFDRKRPWDMIDLHAKLGRWGTVHTILVGNGELEHDLRERARGMEGIHFAGFQDQKGARACYYAADLLVVPSEYETWGLVINEAASAGLPTLATDTCGAANDLVETGKTGFVYPVGNLDIATTLVAPYLSNRAGLRRIGENARARVTTEYTVAQFAMAIERAFLKISVLAGA